MSSCIKRAAARALAAAAVALSAVGAANAAYIHADLTHVGGSTWDASFTVGADPGQTVEAFSVYFDWTKVSNLQVWASPGDWDNLVVQADGALASDGYYDALALADGITDTKVLGGFIARFDWADSNGPTALRFTINDPLTFAQIEQGVAALTNDGAGPTPVPEPAGWPLIFAGMASLVVAGRKARELNS